MADTTTLLPLDASTVAKPDLPVRILQFGGGRFLRAFADQMVQRANEAGVLHAGIAIVQATDAPDRAASALQAQDGLYHVVLEGVRDDRPVREVTRVECVRAVVRAHGEFDRYRELYLDPDVRVVVSNTTEAGIVWVEDDDLAARPPASFPAKVAALLHDRFRHFDGDPAAGLAFVCCELIEDNATTLRAYVLRHAADAALGEDFAAWVRTACTFHDSLVDRIVPGFPRDEIDAIQAELGFADEDVVKGELYGQWVIGGDPVIRDLLPLDRAGLPVVFLPDVRPFRDTKVRILNGQHSALAPVGLLLGCESVGETVARPEVAAFLDRLLRTEILPTVPGDPAAAEAFAAEIAERFTNPFLHHRLSDIMLNASSKWAARNLPVLLDAWGAGREAPLTTFGLAAILVVLGGGGRYPAGQVIVRDDPDVLAAVRDALAADDLVVGVRRVVDVTGWFPAADDDRAERLARAVAQQVARVLEAGAATALGDLLAVPAVPTDGRVA
ncbi:tagaturonate reductase [Luteimicrobium subarcticum]|uniref:tagaturonate reductase n=1 Tax=Luteimicrobium subarcticum TaxID=620910 RepID=UPI0012FE7BC1|nr:tagaturonate reductase [Luteimicrobium subarcticum]